MLAQKVLAETLSLVETPQSPDPLQAGVPLLHVNAFFPYGFPVHIISNSSVVLECANVSWGRFLRRANANPIELRVIVSDHGAEAPRPPVYRAQGNLLTLVADAHNFGCCDLETGFGFVHISKAVLSDSEFFRYHFLEGIVYTLLNSEHILTVHAACVSKEGEGILLIGESGAGKSSFSYACAKRGWTYVSDDASSVLLDTHDRIVVGNPSTIRFRPSALVLFPELQGREKARNGKPTVELRTEHFSGFHFAEECKISYLIFLERNVRPAGAATLKPVSPVESHRRIYKSPLPPELDVHRIRREAVQRLVSAPSYALEYNSFDPAVRLLEQLIEDGKAVSV